MYSYSLFLDGDGDGDAKFSTLWGSRLANVRVRVRVRAMVNAMANGGLRAKATIFISFYWAVLDIVGSCCDANADRI